MTKKKKNKYLLSIKNHLCGENRYKRWWQPPQELENNEQRELLQCCVLLRGITSDLCYHLSASGPLSPVIVKVACLLFFFSSHFTIATHQP